MKNHFSPFHHRLQAEWSTKISFLRQTHGPLLTASSAARLSRGNESILPARALRALSPAAGVCYATPDNAGGNDSSPEFSGRNHPRCIVRRCSIPRSVSCFCAISVTFIKGAYYIGIIAETTAKGISLPFRIQHRLLLSIGIQCVCVEGNLKMCAWMLSVLFSTPPRLVSSPSPLSSHTQTRARTLAEAEAGLSFSWWKRLSHTYEPLNSSVWFCHTCRCCSLCHGRERESISFCYLCLNIT